MPPTLADLVARWTGVQAAERANYQIYLTELCQALGVEPPRPAGSGYQFEFPVNVVTRDGAESTNFVDLYKKDHFALEAKDHEAGRSTDLLLRRAFGQVRGYVGHLPHERPPYLLVMDVGQTLLLWDRWSGDYGGFPAGRRIDLTRIHQNEADQALLRDIWTNPSERDPRSKAVAVTKEIAVQLADLAGELEAHGYEQERVARFLMRCVFTMFAEDVGLLPGEPFRRIIEEVGLTDPAEFVTNAEALWQAMDRGERFLLRRLLRFNGHFFQEAEALPLTRPALAFLLEASRADWQHVEPSIFGTLLTRALDPVERHRMGAEFTPREFVERVVRPTVYDPLRERWSAVLSEVVQLRESGRPRDLRTAEQRLRDFHGYLRGLRILDPACGSGNFLYVTMHLIKRIELEVLRELAALTGAHEFRIEEVGPWQFHGIEVNAWAREIAELTLWIGFHQFWREHHDVQPPEPILRDTGTLEARDAVLAWDEKVEDLSRSRPDPTPRIVHPVTGRRVPDPEARLLYYEYRGARPAEWPQADFIVGNPPYMGTKRMREAFGHGYVEALRATYREVPHSADYVMYWWYRAAREVADGRTIRAGLITTNSIRMAQNRVLVERAATMGAGVVWAIADHPWVADTDSAAVRVAMTVVGRESRGTTLVEVDDTGAVLREFLATHVNSDLSADLDVAGTAIVPLQEGIGLSSFGFMIAGAGFILDPAEAHSLMPADAEHQKIIRPYRNGRDLTQRPRGVFLIDFGLREEEEARTFPVLYDLVRSRVKPERDANNRAAMRRNWWRFGEPRKTLRAALDGLSRYIATVETSKHRFFTFLDASIAPDHKLICIGTDDAFHLGVLSSGIHVAWALATGGRLEDRPVYNKTLCFDSFPFPEATPELRAQIAELAEQLDQHRKDAIARDQRVTMTGMYNVVEKLRSSTPLIPGERSTHELAACGVLRDLHDDLNLLVAEAYGWPWPLAREEILERLVVLHDKRAEEEAAGEVRWLRPDYQVPRYGRELAAVPTELGLVTESEQGATAPIPWPSAVVDQITALKDLLTRHSLTLDEAVSRFSGARSDVVQRQLDFLVSMGEMTKDAAGHYGVPALTETLSTVPA